MPDVYSPEELAAIAAFPASNITKCPTKYVWKVNGADPVGNPQLVEIKKRDYKTHGHELAKVMYANNRKSRRQQSQERADSYAAHLGDGIWPYDDMLAFAKSICMNVVELRRFMKEHGYGERLGKYVQKPVQGAIKKTLDRERDGVLYRRAKGMSKANIAKEMRISKERVRRILNENGAK